VVAYRQPVLRADVDSMRGADSGAAMRGLVDKGMIKVVGRSEAVGRPLLYGTADRFLERFGLKSLRDLPREAMSSGPQASGLRPPAPTPGEEKSQEDTGPPPEP